MRFGFILLLFLMPFAARAQKSDFGNWLILIGGKKINPKWNIHYEVQHRNYNALGELEQLLLRTGIGYNFTENNNNLLLGYAYINSENYPAGGLDKTVVNEHRIFQQFTTRQKFNRVSIQHRYRFEQRFIEKDFKMRFRYFLALAVQLDKKDKYYLSAYNEIFLNSKTTVFDRNRLYGGFGYKLNPKVRFELGYMNQFLQNKNRDQVNVFTYLNL